MRIGAGGWVVAWLLAWQIDWLGWLERLYRAWRSKRMLEEFVNVLFTFFRKREEDRERKRE